MSDILWQMNIERSGDGLNTGDRSRTVSRCLATVYDHDCRMWGVVLVSRQRSLVKGEVSVVKRVICEATFSAANLLRPH